MISENGYKGLCLRIQYRINSFLKIYDSFLGRIRRKFFLRKGLSIIFLKYSTFAKGFDGIVLYNSKRYTLRASITSTILKKLAIIMIISYNICVTVLL